MLILSASPLLTLSFGQLLFQIANISSTSIISINFNSESIITRQGTQVSPTAPVTFLYGTFYPPTTKIKHILFLHTFVLRILRFLCSLLT